ncbi:MAG: TauD/TfdA dioxygenase family protein [Microthrixaceae bacterium]
MFTVDQHLRIGPAPTLRTPEDLELRDYERLSLAPLSPTIGAEVSGYSLDQPLDDETRAELHQALLEWKVLFFRDQDITRDQQRDFALQWGELEQHPFYTYVQRDQDDEDVVRLAKDAANAGTENGWHADVTWNLRPSYGAVLRAVEVPALGGDTLFADAGAAYDDLPEDVKERIDGLVAVHDWRNTFGLAMPDEDRARLSPHFPPIEHAVVRLHPETGRRTLFVNAFFTSHVLGMSEAESHELLAVLYRQFTRPEYQCRFRWRPGSVAFWDNRATQHYASSDYAPQRRVMDRISIAGDVPRGLAHTSCHHAT